MKSGRLQTIHLTALRYSQAGYYFAASMARSSLMRRAAGNLDVGQVVFDTDQPMPASDQLLVREPLDHNPTEHDPAGTLATLAPTGEHRFRLEGGAVSGPHGETVTFELDKEGKVARLRIGENFSLPVRD